MENITTELYQGTNSKLIRFSNLLPYLTRELANKLGDGFLLTNICTTSKKTPGVLSTILLFRTTPEQFQYSKENNKPPHREQFVILYPVLDDSDDVFDISYVKDAVRYFNGPILAIAAYYNDSKDDLDHAIDEIANYLINDIEPNSGLPSKPLTVN